MRRLTNITLVLKGLGDKPSTLALSTPVKIQGSLRFGLAHLGYAATPTGDRATESVQSETVEITTLDRFAIDAGDAATHDSQVLDDILDGDNTGLSVWADSAYRSAEIEAALKERGLRSRIHRKGRRNKPLSEREKQGIAGAGPLTGAGNGTVPCAEGPRSRSRAVAALLRSLGRGGSGIDAQLCLCAEDP